MSVSFSRCVLVGNSVLLSLPSRLDLEATVTGESIKHRPVTEIINLLKQLLKELEAEAVAHEHWCSGNIAPWSELGWIEGTNAKPATRPAVYTQLGVRQGRCGIIGYGSHALKERSTVISPDLQLLLQKC